MRSYPNLIPLSAAAVQQIGETLAQWPYETIYGGWWERVIKTNAKQVMAESVDQYRRAVTGQSVFI